MSNKAMLILIATIIFLVLILNISFITMPFMLFMEILLLGIETFFVIKIIKIVNKEKRQKIIESQLIINGYEKVCDNFFINQKEKKVKINNKDYDFSNILSYDVMEGKQYLQTRTYCTELYINITTNDLTEPNIRLDFEKASLQQVNGKNYNKAHKELEEAISTLDIIISSDEEKNYIHADNITTIEHKHIHETDVAEQIEHLNELYKSGVLTEYEFSTKKMELLEKNKHN